MTKDNYNKGQEISPNDAVSFPVYLAKQSIDSIVSELADGIRAVRTIQNKSFDGEVIKRHAKLAEESMRRVIDQLSPLGIRADKNIARLDSELDSNPN